MRAFAACLTVFLGLGAMTALASTMAGCSDSTDAGGSGGASGAATAAGATSGGASATAGSGGAAACKFSSTACLGCITGKCTDKFAACGNDDACKAALDSLGTCACTTDDTEACQRTFVTDGGDVALDLTECYTVNNCDQDCQ